MTIEVRQLRIHARVGDGPTTPDDPDAAPSCADGAADTASVHELIEALRAELLHEVRRCVEQQLRRQRER